LGKSAISEVVKATPLEEEESLVVGNGLSLGGTCNELADGGITTFDFFHFKQDEPKTQNR